MFLLLSMLALAPQNLIDQRPDPKDMILIDGAKEPHRIPEWTAWRAAFRLMRHDKTKDDLPTELYYLVTPAEVARILGAVRASLENDTALQKRGMELQQKLLAVRVACDAKEDTAEKRTACFIREGNLVSRGWEEEEIAFRQRTLDIRDQLLEQLEKGGRLDVKLALMAWVEARKAELKLHIHRSNLDHYYQPR